MNKFLNEQVTDMMWNVSKRLKDIRLRKDVVPIVWCITLLDPGKLITKTITLLCTDHVLDEDVFFEYYIHRSETISLM